MPTKQVDIQTPDGACDAYAVYPSEDGCYPGVLLFMDAIGVRPALVAMAEKLAKGGYYVLVPNLFYRSGRAPLIDHEAMLEGEGRSDLMAQMLGMMGRLTPDLVERDAGAYLDHLSAQPQVRPGHVATTGFSMGGAAALRTAAHFPDRIAAAASFHGSHLVTEDPDSPHRLVDRIRAELYLGHASDDPSCPAAQIEELETALELAHVPHQTEIYQASHGWIMPDVSWSYDESAAETAWDRLFDLLDRALK